MHQTVQIQLQPAAFVGDDVASFVNASAAVAVAQLLDWMDGVALLAVADAGCIAQCIFHTLK